MVYFAAFMHYYCAIPWRYWYYFHLGIVCPDFTITRPAIQS